MAPAAGDVARPAPDRRRPRWIEGVAVALATFAVMVATSPRLAIVWDEGYTLGREARLRSWFRAMADPPGFSARWRPPEVELVQQDGMRPPSRSEVDSRAKLLGDPRVLAWFWPFAREEPHGHPPFYALVGLIGDVLAPSWEPLPRARLGPILAFSLTAGIVYAFFSRRWGAWSAAAAAGAWVLQPNLFGHGHYAAYDGLLASLWVASILAFAGAVDLGAGGGPLPSANPRKAWVVAFGILWGLAADVKLTGWFLPLPFLAWTAASRDRRGALTLGAGALIALATLYVLNPPWWHAPVEGVVAFWRSNLGRGRSIPINVMFLSKIYRTPNVSLPWYNTLAWTLFVTPPGLLSLAIAGAVRAWRRRRSEPFGPLVVGHWAFLLLLRALPHTPGHDGVRQFLPAFGCLALSAGLGGAWAVERLGLWGKLWVGGALAGAAASVALMTPVPLSYYSPIIGGPPGAEALGMEPTYYWDALSDQAIDWLNRHTSEGQKVRFANDPTSWIYLHQTGKLRPDTRPSAPGRWAWYVVQNRPGSFHPWDRDLIARGRPSYVVRKAGVPLLWVFPFSELEAWQQQQQHRSADRPRSPR